MNLKVEMIDGCCAMLSLISERFIEASPVTVMRLDVKIADIKRGGRASRSPFPARRLGTRLHRTLGLTSVPFVQEILMLFFNKAV
jgi:hypothetical protein